MMRKLFTGLLLLAVALSGCTLSTSNAQDSAAETDAPRAWFDAPLPNTVFFPPSPCQIVAHGASPGGIATFELSINGAVTASIPSPDTQNSLVTLTQDCGLSEPGNYLLQLRAQDNDGNWSGFAQTNLVIASPEEPSTTPPATEPPAPEIPTPTLTPTIEPTGEVSIEGVSTNLVYLGSSDCGPLNVSITARASAPKGIKVVVLFYRFETGNSSAGFESASMNPIGNDLYQGNLNPTSLLSNSIPFNQATLQYQVVVQQDDGDTSIRTPVMADIAVQACGNTSPSAVDCASYTSERTCVANGCNWVSIPGTVPIYACQNP